MVIPHADRFLFVRTSYKYVFIKDDVFTFSNVSDEIRLTYLTVDRLYF